GAAGQALAVALVAEVVANFTGSARPVPAESAIRDRLGGDVLEAAQERILFGHAVYLAEDEDLHQALERVEEFEVEIGMELLSGFVCGFRCNIGNDGADRHGVSPTFRRGSSS